MVTRNIMDNKNITNQGKGANCRHTIMDSPALTFLCMAMVILTSEYQQFPLFTGDGGALRTHRHTDTSCQDFGQMISVFNQSCHFLTAKQQGSEKEHKT